MAKQQEDWDDLGKVDPLWAIYSDPRYRFGRWDLDDFFATGDDDVEAALTIAAELGHPHERKLALDFGCGVGRLTRAIAKHFDCCYGLDISESMIARATELNRTIDNCKFLVNESDRLDAFPDDSLDFVYSQWVLQHVSDRAVTRSYLEEFVRVLKPDGLLVFQLRTSLRARDRVQLGRRLYVALRALGLGQDFLYQRLKISPMRLSAMPCGEVRDVLEKAGARVLRESPYTVKSGEAAFYYVTK